MKLFWSRKRVHTQLERKLGYRFSEPALLEVALTHPSRAHEQGSERWKNYERMEFLGDALLGFVVAEWLYLADEQSSEGTLTGRRQSVVRTRTLATAARRIGLGDELRMGRGEEQTGGRDKRSLLADTFEAVVGAIYLDGGHQAARRFLIRHLEPELLQATRGERPRDDYKTTLQERVQGKLHRTPRYRIVSTSGPPHAREFEVEVLVGDEVMGTGRGSNRKRAEQQAAAEALARAERSEDGECDPENGLD